MFRTPAWTPLMSAVILVGCLALAARAGEDAGASAAQPPGKPLPESCRPCKRQDGDGAKKAAWDQSHADFLAIALKGGVDLLFLGDSITNQWREQGKPVWDQHFAPLAAANFGINGDQTQNVLWRVQNGELDGIQPKLIVLLIGTNNTAKSRHSPEDIAAGVSAVLKAIKAKCPKAKVLLLAIFPTKIDPESFYRRNNDQANALLAKLDDGGKTVRFMDLNAKLMERDRTISHEIFPDLLHLSEKGYTIWAEAIIGTVKEMMGVKPPEEKKPRDQPPPAPAPAPAPIPTPPTPAPEK
jgi:lysophospholipase L1-like esterase